MKYKVALHRSEEGNSVSCPGLPGCWSQGQTEQEAPLRLKCAASFDIWEEWCQISMRYRQKAHLGSHSGT